MFVVVVGCNFLTGGKTDRVATGRQQEEETKCCQAFIFAGLDGSPSLVGLGDRWWWWMGGGESATGTAPAVP